MLECDDSHKPCNKAGLLTAACVEGVAHSMYMKIVHSGDVNR